MKERMKSDGFVLVAVQNNAIVGMSYSPVFMFGAVSGNGDFHIGALMIICGFWGIISLANLALHVLSKRNRPGHPIQWFGILLGTTACGIGLTTMTTTIFMLFLFIGPIIAIVHLLYLSKQLVQTT